MSAPTMMQRAHAFLAERRRLGFKAHTVRYALFSFARHADRQHLKGPLTVECMNDWARLDKWQRGKPETWARRLKQLRPFTRWLRQFEPRTEVPDESVFGPVPGRVAPHVYREDEIVALRGSKQHARCGRPGSLLGVCRRRNLRLLAIPSKQRRPVHRRYQRPQRIFSQALSRMG